MRAALAFLAAALVSGCATASELVAKGSDPDAAREDRVAALHDALERREGGVAQDLTTRAEVLIGAQGTPGELAKNRACALDIVEALVRAGDKTGPALSVRLADHESALLTSRAALAVLARHPDPTVRDLARARLERLPRSP